jgi:purine-binding chemotaxis protein CheW
MKKNEVLHDTTVQLTTFYVGKDLYGIEVMRVQEVTGESAIVPVPLAPVFVRGLINLRGQIATALGLSELFGISKNQGTQNKFSVVCRIEGNLVALLVDSIGDVVEISNSQFEKPPETVQPNVRKFLKGIYKVNSGLLSVLDLEKLAKELTFKTETNEVKAAV